MIVLLCRVSIRDFELVPITHFGYVLNIAGRDNKIVCV